MTYQFDHVLKNVRRLNLAIAGGDALAEIGASLDTGQNDSGWLRDAFRRTKSLNDVVRLQSRLWSGEQRSRAARWPAEHIWPQSRSRLAGDDALPL